MAITRRDFLKYSAVLSGGLLLGIFDLKPIVAYAQANPPEWLSEKTSICCFCGVGCGVIVGTKSTAPYVTYVQGDPDHPINNGSLCSKGGSLAQLRTVDGALNLKRVTTVKYRRPNDTVWEEYDWDDLIHTDDGLDLSVLDLIARRIRDTRDTAWDNTAAGGNPPEPLHPYTVTREDIDDGVTPNETPVNRCTGIASLGGAALDNEECYLLVKLMRALGLVYIEHQARI